jgi:hypothetical protein
MVTGGTGGTAPGPVTNPQPAPGGAVKRHVAVGLFEGSQFGTAEFTRREANYGFKFEHILRFHSIYDLRYWEVKQILDTGHKVIVVSTECSVLMQIGSSSLTLNVPAYCLGCTSKHLACETVRCTTRSCIGLVMCILLRSDAIEVLVLTQVHVDTFCY